MKANDTLLRQICMLREIPRHPRRVSTAEIQMRLESAGYETTLRTIQRDLLKLSASLPLLSDDSKPQGWSWQADADQLELPALEPQAALVFYLAFRYLTPLLPSSSLDYLTPWFQTAVGVLNNQQKELSTWRDKVRVLAPGQPRLAPSIDSDVQRSVTQGLLLNRKLSVTYRPRDLQESRQYEVSPLALVVRDQVIYLVCTLREYEDIRQLVLSRICSAEILNVPVRKTIDFDIDQYIANGGFGLQERTSAVIPLVVDFDVAVINGLIERPLAFDQQVTFVNKEIKRMTASVPNTEELKRWLLGFGPSATVVSPDHLRLELKSMIRQMYKQYE